MTAGGARSIAEFAAELRAELDRAGLSVRALAAKIAALPENRRPGGMSYQSLSEFTSRGRRVRLPSDQQLSIVLTVCRTDRARAAQLRADRSFLASFPPERTPVAVRPSAPRSVGLTALAQHEVVVHLFVVAAGPAVELCWEYLRATWRRCVDEFDMTVQVRDYAGELPQRCPAVGPGDAFLAARARPGPGVVELAARRVHDVVCLSLVIAPEDGTSWADLLASWQAVRTEPPAQTLGSVVIAQATQVQPGGAPDATRLRRQVEAELALDGLILRDGTLRADGPYEVWEAVEDSDDPAAVNRRCHRDLVVVAAPGGMRQLSGWTWSRGGTDRELPPFARYLMHAAKLRYCARVRASADVDAVRRTVDELVDRPQGRIAELRAATASLQRRTEQIELLQATVDIAARNLARNAGNDQQGGMFADDQQLAEWLTSSLENDLRYLRITLGAAGRVLAQTPDDDSYGKGDVDLQPHQRRALIGALESAYPTYADLAYMFDTELGRNLAVDAREAGMRLVLNDVIRRAIAEGRLDELVAAAIAGNKGNERLTALHTSGLAPHSGAIGSREREFAEQVVDMTVGFRSAIVFLVTLLHLAGRVCLVEVTTGGRRVSGGTGFLVGPDLVLTNYHVLEHVVDGDSSPADVTCTFDYHELPDGLSRGAAHRLTSDGILANSPDTPTGLDYALVRLDGRPGDDHLPDGTTRGYIQLPRNPPNFVVGMPLLILQHPDCHPLQLAWNNRGVAGVDDDGMRISHAVNTAGGSSGSPCLTYDLELVALHRGRLDEETGGGKRNRAVPIHLIRADLATRWGIQLP